MRSPPVSSKGFTLIELMVVLVIVGILAAIAYPAYTALVKRSRRADAMALLTAVMQAQERYRSNHSAYTRDLDALRITPSHFTKHYDVQVLGVGNTSSLESGYVATATATADGLQSTDDDCKQLALALQGGRVSYLAYNAASSPVSSGCWTR